MKAIKTMSIGVVMCVGVVSAADVMAAPVPAKVPTTSKRVIVKGAQESKRVRVAAVMAKAPKLPDWKRWLQQGYQLSVQRSAYQRRRGLRLLLNAYRKAPRELDAMVGAARAYMLLAMANKGKKGYWGNKGWGVAKKMIRLHPQRAEGYMWSAVHIGLVGDSNHMSAFFRGLPKKIERMALASIRRNPRLYRGAAQRLLGRFFYKLPWPMRRIKKSRKLLRAAYSLSPRDPHGLLFYGETLKAVGHKSLAKKLFRFCSRASRQQPFTNPMQAPVGEVIAQCRKHLR